MAVVVIGVGLLRMRLWRAFSIYSIGTGVVALVTLALTFATSQPSISESARLGGLMERLLVVELLL